MDNGSSTSKVRWGPWWPHSRRCLFTISTSIRSSSKTTWRGSMAHEPLLIPLVRRSAAQARYVLTGSLLLLGGFQVVIAGQASAIESAQSFGRMAELVPAFLQRGLGSKA